MSHTAIQTVVHEPRRVSAASHTTMVLAIVLTMLGGFTILGGFAKAEGATRAFAIPAQPLGDALAQFADETNLKLVADSTLVQGLRSPGVSGAFTPSEALDRLLAGTPVRHRFLGPDTMTVEPIPEPDLLGRLVDEASRPLPLAETKPEQQGPAKGEAEPTGALPEMTVTASPYDETSYSVPNASTATKTDTPIMETPVSIQVLPRTVFDDLQAITLEDAVRNISGVLYGPNDGDFEDQFIVRGFDLGRNTYRNGFRIQTNQSETANLERLEVLKGAAAMLYGRIEPGGLLNRITKKPLEMPYYSLQQQFGSYELYRTTLDATGPVLGDDTLLYRFNLAYQNNNSFRDFIEGKRVFVAPSLTWNATPDTQFNLNVEYKHDDNVDDYGHPAVGRRPANIPIDRNLGEPGAGFELDFWLVEFTGSHAFNEDWEIRGGAKADSTDFFFRDVSNRVGTLLPDARGRPERIIEKGVFFGSIDRDSQGFYLDLTGHFDLAGTKHTVLLGGDYYSFQDDNQIFANGFAPFGCAIDIFAPTYGCVDFARFEALAEASPDFSGSNTEQWGGIYFQDQITVWDKVRILGGGRYDWANTSEDTSFTSVDGVTFDTSTDVDNERFSPRVGISYQPWSWLSVYGHYSESFGSANGLSVTGQAFPPQIGKQYEGGIKAAWEELTANLAFYHLEKDNLLTTDPNTGLSVPLGSARSQGIELDLSGNVTDRLSLIATYAFTDARLTKSNDLSGEIALVGRRLQNVPEHQGSLWTKYAVTDQFSVGTGVFLVGERGGDPTESFKLPGYARWDAMAAYRFDVGKTRLIAQLNVNNILDKEYYKSALSRLRIGIGDPLTFLGSIRVEF